jgi:putative DNA primase/helicase
MAFGVDSIGQMGAPADGVSLLEQVPGDTGNAHRFLALHRDDVRYCHAFKSWFHWDGRRWCLDKKAFTTRLAKDVTIKYLKQASAANNREEEKLAKFSLNTPRINGMLTLAQDEVAIAPEEFDRHPDLMLFKNGTLDLSTGLVRDFNRGDLITKLVHYDYLPSAPCGLFLSFLNRLMGAEKDETRAKRLVDALQMYFGYSLTGHTSAKAVFMLIGPKDTGKTTLLELFCRLLAEQATLVRIETLMEGPAQRNLGLKADLADLHSVRFARTSETEEGKRLSEAQLKYITQGMGKIRAERKFENPFEFEETHHLWIDANFKPVIRGTDPAIWDRLFLVPFDEVIPEEEKDPQLLAKLLLEAEGILAWAVAGAQRWYENGRRLPRPDEVREAGDVYRAEMDVVGRFLGERCELEGRFSVGSTELYKAYQRWAEAVGEHPIAQRLLSSRMKDRSGIEAVHKDTGTVFLGLRVRTEGPNRVSEGDEA